MIIKPSHIISIKGKLEQLNVGDQVYLNEHPYSVGTVHDHIMIYVNDCVVHEIVPDEHYRFVLRPKEPPENRGGAPSYTFLQYHKQHPVYIRVRADEVAGLIAQEGKDDLEV